MAFIFTFPHLQHDTLLKCFCQKRLCLNASLTLAFHLQCVSLYISHSADQLKLSLLTCPSALLCHLSVYLLFFFSSLLSSLTISLLFVICLSMQNSADIQYWAVDKSHIFFNQKLLNRNKFGLQGCRLFRSLPKNVTHYNSDGESVTLTTSFVKVITFCCVQTAVSVEYMRLYSNVTTCRARMPVEYFRWVRGSGSAAVKQTARK